MCKSSHSLRTQTLSLLGAWLGQRLGHVTHYKRFGASIISLEGLNLKSSNFVGYINSSNRKTYHQQLKRDVVMVT